MVLELLSEGRQRGAQLRHVLRQPHWDINQLRAPLKERPKWALPSLDRNLDSLSVRGLNDALDPHILGPDPGSTLRMLVLYSPSLPLPGPFLPLPQLLSLPWPFLPLPFASYQGALG